MFHRYIFFVRACSWFIYILIKHNSSYFPSNINTFHVWILQRKIFIISSGKVIGTMMNLRSRACLYTKSKYTYRFSLTCWCAHGCENIFFVYSFSVISLTYLSEIMILENEPFHDKLRIHEFQAKCRRTQGFSNSHLLHRLTFFVTLWGKNIENRWTWI